MFCVYLCVREYTLDAVTIRTDEPMTGHRWEHAVTHNLPQLHASYPLRSGAIRTSILQPRIAENNDGELRWPPHRGEKNGARKRTITATCRYMHCH